MVSEFLFKGKEIKVQASWEFDFPSLNSPWKPLSSANFIESCLVSKDQAQK